MLTATAIAIIAIAFACCCVFGGMSLAAKADDQADAMLRADTKFRRIRDSERAAIPTEKRRLQLREHSIQRSRWPQLELIYAEIERAGDA